MSWPIYVAVVVLNVDSSNNSSDKIHILQSSIVY